MNEIIIDAAQAKSRELVKQLHAHADTCEQLARQATADGSSNPIFWETLQQAMTDAACQLDDYQCGFALATPRPETGFKLVATDEPVALDEEHGTFVLRWTWRAAA